MTMPKPTVVTAYPRVVAIGPNRGTQGARLLRRLDRVGGCDRTDGRQTGDVVDAAGHVQLDRVGRGGVHFVGDGPPLGSSARWGGARRCVPARWCTALRFPVGGHTPAESAALLRVARCRSPAASPPPRPGRVSPVDRAAPGGEPCGSRRIFAGAGPVACRPYPHDYPRHRDLVTSRRGRLAGGFRRGRLSVLLPRPVAGDLQLQRKNSGTS